MTGTLPTPEEVNAFLADFFDWNARSVGAPLR